MAAIEALIGRLTAAGDALAALRPGVEAGAPWPPVEHFGTEPEASWGPGETLAHVAEMIPYWQGEIERILAGDGAVPFGRVATDAVRIGLIERDRSLPPRELFDRIEAGVDRLARRLGTLSADERRRAGVHPRLGEMTVEAIVERFLAGHLEEHVEQLRAIVARGGD